MQYPVYTTGANLSENKSVSQLYDMFWAEVRFWVYNVEQHVEQHLPPIPCYKVTKYFPLVEFNTTNQSETASTQIARTVRPENCQGKKSAKHFQSENK